MSEKLPCEITKIGLDSKNFYSKDIKDLEEVREMFKGAFRAHIIDREEAKKQINRINKQLWKLRERLKTIGGDHGISKKGGAKEKRAAKAEA